MPQSLSYILIHLVFSTKDRVPFLEASIRLEVHAYLATTVRNIGGECYRVGGVADHVHLAVRLPRTMTVSTLVEEVKTFSSRWIKSKGPQFSDFSW